MLDHLLESNREAGANRRPFSFWATFLLHVVALGTLLFYNLLRIPPIPEPTLQVSFAQIAPPPPPPPPAPAASTPKPVMPKVNEMIEPEKTPETVDLAEPDTMSTSSPDGEPGGVEGGVPGGVVGSVPVEPAGPLRIGGDVLPPEIQHRVPPVYPPAARNARIQGVVILEIIVRREGTVDPANIKVIKGVNLGVTDAAIDAVKQWRYKPATRHGLPVDVVYRVEVSFILR